MRKLSLLALSLLVVQSVIVASEGKLLSGRLISNPPNTGMADPVALINAFDKFLKGVPTGGSHVLTMPLVALRGITSESMNASGQVTIDLSTGLVMSQVRGLPAD